MSLYAKINGSNGIVQYPYTVDTFKEENPHTKVFGHTDLSIAYVGTEDSIESGNSVVRVVSTQMPDFSGLQTIEEGDPTFSSDEWVQTWNIIEPTEEQINAAAADSNAETRALRDDILRKSDYTQISDYNTGLTDQEVADYATWRQELRDITTHANWPNLSNDDWPTEPGTIVNDARIS